jgi:serine-type D-Ala-D-Ala endopeptidase (penicillin-binding protein 7)
MKGKLASLCVVLALMGLVAAPVADAKVERPRHSRVTVQYKKASPQFRKVSMTESASQASGAAPRLRSWSALIIEEDSGKTLYAKNTDLVTPIASITKLMTAMVVLDADLPLDEQITITDDDVDLVKGTRSRLSVGATLSRGDLLRLALMSSENRAAAALGRSYPEGREAFVAAMNAKAELLGMHNSRFVDPTGLRSENVSTAADLVRMVEAASQYPAIREFSTLPSYDVELPRYRRPVEFHNTNALVRGGNWDIGLQKTGYISEAGRCLVMQANVAGRPVIIVLLDSVGKNTRIGDANRIRKWMESGLGTPYRIG